MNLDPNGHINKTDKFIAEQYGYTGDCILNTRTDIKLSKPDMGALRKERLQRTRATMEVISATMAHKVIPKPPHPERVLAAICIQAHWRGYLARKRYLDLLYEQYEKEEVERQAKIQQQVEEGQLLVDNYRLNREVEEEESLRRNKKRSIDCHVTTIQRAWRSYCEQKYMDHDDDDDANDANDAYLPFLEDQHHYENPRDIDSEDCSLLQGQDRWAYAGEHDESDVFNDSLEPDEPQYDDRLDHHEEQELMNPVNSCSNVNYFKRTSDCTEGTEVEFPSPTTDWESIESYLNTESVSPEKEKEHSFAQDEFSKRLSVGPTNLQICFVDDTVYSDNDENECDIEIKEYTIQREDSDNSDLSKRDSGCMGSDDGNNEPLEIKTIHPEELEKFPVTREATKVVLEALNKQEENQIKYSFEELQKMDCRELYQIIIDLEKKIKVTSDMLVKHLMERDAMHLEQDSLLTEVEDITKKNGGRIGTTPEQIETLLKGHCKD